MFANQGRQVGSYWNSGDPAWLFPGMIAPSALFIALIWWGVPWSRTLSGTLSFGTAIDFLLAWLSLQPESRTWFYGEEIL